MLMHDARNVLLEALAGHFPACGRESGQIQGFRICAKRFADGTFSFAFRMSRLRFKHEPVIAKPPSRRRNLRNRMRNLLRRNPEV